MAKIAQLMRTIDFPDRGIMKLAVSWIKVTFYQDLSEMLMQLYCKK